MDVDEFIEGFADGTLSPRKRVQGNWRIEDAPNDTKTLVFYPTGEDLDRRATECPVKEVLAIRFNNNRVVYNANTLQYIGTTMAWGNRTSNWGQTSHQRIIERAGGIGIPFNVFTDDTELNVYDMVFMVTPPVGGETVIRKRKMHKYTGETHEEYTIDEPTHFIGASVFKVRDTYYLFDVDRKELDNGVFNPFIVQLPKKATSVEDAYDTLLPDEVRNATSPVYRQGEYYFIFTGDELPVHVDISNEDREIIKHIPSRFGYGAEDTVGYWDTREYYPHELKENVAPQKLEFNTAMQRYNATLRKFEYNTPKEIKLDNGGSGSHKASRGVISPEGITYVSGKVEHTRRDHAELELTGWYKVVKNLAVRSLQINGNVD